MDDSYNNVEASQFEFFVPNNAGTGSRSPKYSPTSTSATYNTIFIVMIVSYLWTLLMTSMPLIVTVKPTDYYKHHNDWYTGSDVMRLLEPIGGCLLNFAVLHNSGIFRHVQTQRTLMCLFTFFLGIALYSQGAGYHSSANMFKNALESIDYDDGNMQDLHFYMRTIWEHIIGHYIYAAGYVLMTFAQAFAFRTFVVPKHSLTWLNLSLLVFSSIIFGLLIAAVAIDFPSGTIVALIYLVLYGLCGFGGYLYYLYHHEDDVAAIQFGCRPVLHHFLLSYILALIIVIAWIITKGGFKSRSQAGVL